MVSLEIMLVASINLTIVFAPITLLETVVRLCSLLQYAIGTLDGEVIIEVVGTTAVN